jgi:hypothetical protein
MKVICINSVLNEEVFSKDFTYGKVYDVLINSHQGHNYYLIKNDIGNQISINENEPGLKFFYQSFRKIDDYRNDQIDKILL